MVARVKSLPRKKKANAADVVNIYCRRCMETKPNKDFYSAVNLELDRNGYFSICKKCCNDIYNNSYTIEHNFEKALLRTCRILDVAWIPIAVEAAKAHLAKKMQSGSEDLQVFGIYKSKMTSGINRADSADVLTFDHSDKGIVIAHDPSVTDDEDFNKYLRDFWGVGFSFEDYEFLESELSRYKKTHKCDTATEESLLRQICFAEYDIRNARNNGGTPDSNAIKRLQELMKTASIDPAKAASANSGKAQDTFSSFIKTIENNEPAEYYKDKALFRDFDNLDFYFKKYVTRPLKNFITQSRDFNTETEDEIDDAVESNSEEDGDFTKTL